MNTLFIGPVLYNIWDFGSKYSIMVRYGLITIMYASVKNHWGTPQQTQYVDPLLFWCWPTVFDVGPSSKQHWIYISSLLGVRYIAELTFQQWSRQHVDDHLNSTTVHNLKPGVTYLIRLKAHNQHGLGPACERLFTTAQTHTGRYSVNTRQTPDGSPVLVQCWPSVCDAGPTLNQHWTSVSCLLGGGRSTVYRLVGYVMMLICQSWEVHPLYYLNDLLLNKLVCSINVQLPSNRRIPCSQVHVIPGAII